MQEDSDSERGDSTPTSDAWWAALVADLLHPIQVQIIEAFRHIGRPLTVRDLSEIVDDVEPVHIDYHLGRLRRLGALDCGVVKAGTVFMDVRFQLAPRRNRHGCC
jgi:DNA-binding transcriptional ArsR family regulator